SITLQGDKLLIEYNNNSPTETKPIDTSELQLIQSYCQSQGLTSLSLSDLQKSNQEKNSREFAKKTYHYLGNYGKNPALYSLESLKQLLRKNDKPTTDKDYYNLYDLVKYTPAVVEKLEKDVAS
ncbi:5580_t:CDS:2, partial [Funneliformis geosporum]